ncbi:MAG: Rho termination factor N-terminal domain-containing protein [Bacilli bacterium]|nr:Rho termination factor N-terminal domain-containing protein [Bacilli bacterium]
MWLFKKKKNKENTESKPIVEKVDIPVVPQSTPAPEEVVKKAEPVKPEILDEQQVSTEPEEQKEEIDLEGMTVVELKALAKDKGLQGYSALKKAELIDLLK